MTGFRYFGPDGYEWMSTRDFHVYAEAAAQTSAILVYVALAAGAGLGLLSGWLIWGIS